MTDRDHAGAGLIVFGCLAGVVVAVLLDWLVR